MEYIIRNDAGASFNIYCPSGQTDTSPGFFFESSKIRLSQRELKNVEVLLIIDGLADGYAANCSPGVCSWKSFNFRTNATLEQSIDKLRAGKSFAISIPSIKASERFAITGARKALQNALQGCEK